MTHYGDTMSWKEEADALREQLAAERKRREEVEDLWHEEQQAHTAAVTRAEQAERERDEARRDKRDMGGIISRTMDALEGDPDDNMVGLARARMGDLQRAEAALSVRTAEYDEMQRSQEAGAQRIRELMAQAERAEADNAALLEAYRRTWGGVMHDNVVHSPDCNEAGNGSGGCAPECPALYVSALLKADHPGAALLERMRALEKVREACEPYRAEEGATDAEKTSERGWELVLACVAYDALKPT